MTTCYYYYYYYYYCSATTALLLLLYYYYYYDDDNDDLLTTGAWSDCEPWIPRRVLIFDCRFSPLPPPPTVRSTLIRRPPSCARARAQ